MSQNVSLCAPSAPHRAPRAGGAHSQRGLLPLVDARVEGAHRRPVRALPQERREGSVSTWRRTRCSAVGAELRRRAGRAAPASRGRSRRCARSSRREPDDRRHSCTHRPGRRERLGVEVVRHVAGDDGDLVPRVLRQDMRDSKADNAGAEDNDLSRAGCGCHVRRMQRDDSTRLPNEMDREQSEERRDGSC